MWKTAEGSTGRLIQFCLGYFTFYVITGVTVKYFTGPVGNGFPGMKDIEFLVYSTVGGSLICIFWVFLKKWYRLKSNGLVTWGGMTFPGEIFYIIPSGICTAVIIVTTTLNYMLLPSVMVAMVITRGSVIVISRIVDAIQIAKGILHKKVYLVEDIAVGLAVLAVATQIFFHGGMPDAKAEAIFSSTNGGLPFWIGWASSGSGGEWSAAAMIVLVFYIFSYMVRIYIMNYFKNTRGKGVPLDNNGFFGVEQISASVTMVFVAILFFLSPTLFGVEHSSVTIFRDAITNPRPQWSQAILAGTAYGIVAFFSVFIFMFKGRTATFAGLVNRLTSLTAGTAATLILHYMYKMRAPKTEDWASLAFILVAVACLTIAEKKRVAELQATQELNSSPRPSN